MSNKRVFSVSESSQAGGESYCWVEEQGGEFFMYGNELGRMSGPCRNAADAVSSAGGFQFGMDYMALEGIIHPTELRRILSGAEFDFSGVSRLSINGTDVQDITVDEIVRLYGQPTSA